MGPDKPVVSDRQEHKMLSKEQTSLIYVVRDFSKWFDCMYDCFSAFVRTVEKLTGEKGTKKNLTLCLGKETASKYCEVFRKGDKKPCEFHGEIEELKGYLDKAFQAKDEGEKIKIIDEMVCKMFKKGIKIEQLEPLPEDEIHPESEVTELIRRNVLE